MRAIASLLAPEFNFERRETLKLSACRGTLLAICAMLAPAGVSEAAQSRTNIILIVADAAGYADIGSYGFEIRAPNIDALAPVDLRFTQFGVSATFHRRQFQGPGMRLAS